MGGRAEARSLTAPGPVEPEQSRCCVAIELQPAAMGAVLKTC